VRELIRYWLHAPRLNTVTTACERRTQSSKHPCARLHPSTRSFRVCGADAQLRHLPWRLYRFLLAAPTPDPVTSTSTSLGESAACIQAEDSS
jgi:hypothetical protein